MHERRKIRAITPFSHFGTNTHFGTNMHFGTDRFWFCIQYKEDLIIVD